MYALDLWEHAPGVALVVGATAVLAGVVDGDEGRWRGPVAGALLGVAATMRTEAIVYSLVAVGGVGLVLLARRQLGRAVALGAGAVGGFAVPWWANRALEEALGGTDRSERASGAAGSGLSEAGDRLREAVITLLGLRADDLAALAVLGGLVAGGVAATVVLHRRGRPDLARIALVLVAALHLAVLVDRGLGFVPGLLAAAPLAVVGLVTAPGRSGGRYVLGVAAGAMPLVWAFQYLGGAFPQWGGRYLLPSTTLLVALGAAALPQLGRGLSIALMGLAGAVTLTGVAWLGERSHDVAGWFDEMAERPEDVLVVRNGFLVREGGAASTERRWLTALTDDDVARAVEVVDQAGLRTLAVIEEAAEPPAEGLPGARFVGTDATELLGVTLYLHRYEVP